jgi:NADH dehydrogenase
MEFVTGATVARFDSTDAELSDGRRFDDCFLCFATGAKSALANVNGDQAQLPDGRIVVDPFLRIPQHPEVFVAGDAAAIAQGEEYLRRAVNFALYSGRRAGGNVVRTVHRSAPAPFRPVDLGWVIPFCDRGVGRILSRVRVQGRFALALHYLMCGYRNYSMRNRLFYCKTAAKALFPS